MGRSELRDAYRIEHPYSPSGPKLLSNDYEARKAVLTAATESSITALIADNQYWLKQLVIDQPENTVNEKAFGRKIVEPKYKTFAQFSVITPTSHHARRIDVIAVENQTVDYRQVAQHGFEIKVSTSDLHQDHKYTEYLDFVDYLWVIIPNQQDMMEQAHADIPAKIGILLADIDNQEIEVDRLATYQRGKLREMSLITAIIKSN